MNAGEAAQATVPAGSAAGRVARVAALALTVLLVAGYPFLLVAGLDRASARTIGALLLAAAVAAAMATGGATSRLLPLALKRFGLVILLAAAAAATDHPAALKLLPGLTNLALLATFASSLRNERSLVEQFAVAMHDGFPDFLLPYCRNVTRLWCVFFALNAAAGIALAFLGSDRAWALFTGGVSYALVGALGAGEYVFHKTRFRFYEDGWSDRLWRRAFPPERTALGRRTLEWQRQRAAAKAGQ